MVESLQKILSLYKLRGVSYVSEPGQYLSSLETEIAQKALF